MRPAALLLWAFTFAALAGPAGAQDGDDGEKVYRANALAHARAIEAAHRRLQRHITADATAATPGSWPQDLPPAATGWVRDWTDRGLRARYCADTLLVWVGPEGMHGGTAQRSVQAAPRLYGPHDTRGPALHWLRRTGTTGVEAHGGAGRTSVTLPTCMTSGLPVERVALASAVGAVPDPWVDTWVSRRADPEWRACPTGHHVPGGVIASGQRWRVVRTRTMSRHGRPIGAETVESQTLETDHCVADYTRHVCIPNASPPPVAVARYFRVEADPSTGATRHRQFVPAPLPPNPCASLTAAPSVQVDETELHRNASCAAVAGAGWSGTARDRRLRRVTTFSWLATPVTAYTPWVPDRSDCVRRTDMPSASACPHSIPRYTGTATRIRTKTERRTRADWTADPVIHTPTFSDWKWETMSCTRQTRHRRWEPCPTGQKGRIEQTKTRTERLRKTAYTPPSADLPTPISGPWSAWIEVSRTCELVVASDESGNGPSGDVGDGGGPAGTTGGGVTGDDTGVSSTDGTGSNQGLGDPDSHDSPGEGGGSGGGGEGPAATGDEF